jgi:hypothetical protein
MRRQGPAGKKNLQSRRGRTDKPDAVHIISGTAENADGDVTVAATRHCIAIIVWHGRGADFRIIAICPILLARAKLPSSQRIGATGAIH